MTPCPPRPPRSRLPALMALLLVTCTSLAHGDARDAIRWQFVVTVDDLARGVATIDWTLQGLSGAQQVCADMDGAERFVSSLQLIEPGPPRALTRGAECWPFTIPRAARGQPVHLRYGYDMRRLAADTGDPDYASPMGGGFLINDETFLLRPDPLPPGAVIDVEFRLPPGVTVAVPWQRLPGPGLHFRYDSRQYEAGSYVALGALHPLGELPVGGGIVTVTLMPGPRQASDDVLTAWVRQAITAVASFYGTLPGGRVHVVLAPVPGAREAGVFGSILRLGLPSAALLFGAQAEAPSFPGHWMAFHELFHLGNPRVATKIPWFIEGFTTYYQDVLRARSGARTTLEMWGDLHDGFRRYCDPQEGRSLWDESRNIRRLHNYTRLYWGGACLAFRVDVAIRERSRGRRSLDAVMLELRQRGLRQPLGEEQVIAALEAEAGAGLVRTHLASRSPIEILPLYRQLGIEPTGDETVTLHEDAPLAALRRTILP